MEVKKVDKKKSETFQDSAISILSTEQERNRNDETF